MIRVCIDDLAFFDGEAIVRPVNEDLGATTPLLRRLELAAGTELHNQIRLQEPLPVGAAIVTSAGELSVELLVHAVVMSRTVHLNPLGVLLSVLVGVELAGFVGALLAIPAAGAIQVVIRDLWDDRQQRLKAVPTIGVDETPIAGVGSE